MNEGIQQIWNTLKRHAAVDRGLRMTTHFDEEPDRLARMSHSAAGLTLDASKNLLSRRAFEALLELAREAGLEQAIDALLRGAIVNPTEDRPALHTALRAEPATDIEVAGHRIGPIVTDVRERTGRLAEDVRDGRWTGYSGERIRDVVNIGIGGSHLGPQLVCGALCYDAREGPRVHFLANVDGGAFDRVVTPLDPATTMFIVASKSFTTAETRLNADSAREWLRGRFGDDAAVPRHFVAVSANADEAERFGIARENIYPMWDWVGGRYSLWSAIGLPIAMAIGQAGFRALLGGAAEMDRHFSHAPFASNLPVLLALIGVWNNNFLDAPTAAVVPYDERLADLPDFLQQLDMESNGKRVSLANEVLGHDTAPITWGGIGTNAQHAFFQLLHQGTRLVPVDFIVAMTHPAGRSAHHDMLVANCFSQAEGLMTGSAGIDGRAMPAGIDSKLHRATPGNHPSNMITMEALTPFTLGSLLAMYEHKTYVQSIIWNINAFDQWGVELGKTLAVRNAQAIERGEPGTGHDPSTAALLERYIRGRLG